MNTSTILLTGGTGRTGRRVAARLQQHHPEYEVRVASRTAPTPFDWDSPDTWDANLAGVDIGLPLLLPRSHVPWRRPRRSRPSPLGLAHTASADSCCCRVEARTPPSAASRSSSTAASTTTVVRCALFAQNFAESFLLGPVLRGRLRFPAAT